MKLRSSIPQSLAAQSLPVLTLLISCALSNAQAPTPQDQPQTPLLKSSATLVRVPTLVRQPTGELLHSLQPSDFQLLDNGVPQQLSLEHLDHQPISLLVVMQTGGAAIRQFQNYPGLPTMLETLAGSSPAQTALLTFDSQPEDLWSFSSSIASLSEGFTKPIPGDDGAAIYDALGYGITLLERQPPGSQRILLLLSQPTDSGSKLREQELITRLGQSDILIYSLTFSPEKTWLKDEFTKPRHANPPYSMPNHPDLIGTFNLSTPLGMALHALRSNTSTELATLSGGASFSFGNRSELERQLSTLANYLPNRYLLTFRPTNSSPDFHSLTVRIPSQPSLQVSARAAYWTNQPDAQPQKTHP